MMEAIIFALAMAVIGGAGTAVAMALRAGALTGRVAQLEASSSNAEKQLQMTAREFADYKQRTDEQLRAAANDAKELRDGLEKCNVPGVQRARLDSLLGKLSARGVTASGPGGTGPVPAIAAPRAHDADHDV